MTRPRIVSLTVGLTLALTICGETSAQTPLTLPIRLNVGSDQPYTAQDGRVYLPDQEWTPETQAGYIGGYQVYGGRFPSGGTPDKILYENQRRNWQEYRFSGIPNGDYLVTMHFSEVAVLEEYGPTYTIFDIAIENRTVLGDLNIFAQVGGNYVLIRRFPVTVTDGELNITSTPVFGESRLAALEVEARSPDAIAPRVPADLTATSSYAAVLLNWANNPESDLDGYHIYRAESPDGPYTRLTADPSYLSRYQDIVPAVHVPYFYRISAVDVYGNESDITFHQSAVALDEEDATLPFYHLELSPDSLSALYNDPWSYDEVRGNFIYEGQPYAVEVRYRGNWGRYHNKKSWKVKFLDDSPFGQDEINLRADYMDTSLMRHKLATDLFEAAGLRPPQAEHVLLAINGEYQGVYTRAEQVDESFLRRTGRNPRASIYKAVETESMDFSKRQPSEQAYRDAFDKKTNTDTDYSDIIAFIELINDTPDDTFAYELGRAFDVVSYLDYYALIVLTSNPDFSSHNAYLIHDLDADRWELVPYDLDHAFQPPGDWQEIPPDTPIDVGTPASPIWNWVTNLLITRVLDVPQFRAYYCHRLTEFMDTIFSDAHMYSLIDATYATIEQDGLHDWYKLGWENNGWFTATPGVLKTYVTERKRFLWEEIPEYCPAETLYLKVNEVMADNQTTLEDPDKPGKFPPWFEIYNAGLETAYLSGLCLTDDLADPARFRITSGITIPAGGFATFYASGDPGHGPWHTNFGLDKRGGQIGIFSGTQQIDAYTFGLQTADVSEGRYPDGVDHRMSFNVPTPRSSNRLLPPDINETMHAPSPPTASEAVTVTAVIVDDGTLLTTTLYYSTTTGGFIAVPMASLQGDMYAARIPPQPDGSLVEYYVLAGDDDGQTSTDPPDPSAEPYAYVVGYQPPIVFINEFMADNEKVLSDPDNPDRFPDWIELYNPGPDPVDLGGRYLTDDLSNPTRFQIAQGITIPAGGFLLFYADGDSQLGPLHTNFRLNKDGENIGLFDIDAAVNRLIDAYTFGPQTADVSEGRCSDGSKRWTLLTTPTPGAANGLCATPPAISNVAHTPSFPSAAEAVTVTAVIADGQTVLTTALWYSAGGGFVAVPMKLAGDNTYRATIPAQPSGTGVAYYVQTEDAHGSLVTDPVGAPVNVHRYLVGYRPPPLFINEFMADNATSLEDPDEPGEFPDWIELYNAGPTPVDLDGKYLTDDLTNPTKFKISAGLTVPAGGFVLFYADGDPEQGPFHTNFKLSRNGESIGLFDNDTAANQAIDTHTFGAQATDVSERRYPNGGAQWVVFRTPTPGRGDVIATYLPVVLKHRMS